MARRVQRGREGLLVLALAGAALLGGSGCKTIHEEVQPIRETTLTVARAGGEAGREREGRDIEAGIEAHRERQRDERQRARDARAPCGNQAAEGD